MATVDEVIFLENERGQMVLLLDLQPGEPDPSARLTLSAGCGSLEFAGRPAIDIGPIDEQPRKVLGKLQQIVVVEMDGTTPKHIYNAAVQAS